MKIAFVTNFCAHYQIKTFEKLAQLYDIDYYFFSDGDEWYWQQELGVRSGDFHFEYLPGFRVGGTRFTPTLFPKLLRGNYDIYIKCINGRFALPLTYMAARLKRKPFVLWTGIWMQLQTAAHRLFYSFTRHFYNHSNAVVVYGDHVKQFLTSERKSAESIFVAAHALDNSVYSQEVPTEKKSSLRKQLGIQPEQKVILYLGRLEDYKGLPYLIEAFASLHRDDAVLVLAGKGSCQKSLENIAAEKGILPKVKFLGYIPPDETPPLYAIAWVFVLPSITTKTSKETWGIVINEAFNQGLPVVVTDIVGAAAGGLVEDGVNGRVVPEKDAVRLAEAMQDILNDPELREHLSRNAFEKIGSWNVENMVRGFQDAIEHVSHS